MANDEFGICATVDRRHRISSTSVRDTHRSKPIASKPVEGCEPAIIQDEKLQDELIKEATQSNCTALVPINNINNNNINNKNFITESAKLTALARVDIVKALQNMRTKYKTKKEADSIFLDLYNSGMYLPKIHKFIGSISIGTLHRWIWAYENNEDYKALLPNYKYTKQGEYNTILTQEMKDIFIKFLLHPNKFSVTKAIKLTQHILELYSL